MLSLTTPPTKNLDPPLILNLISQDLTTGSLSKLTLDPSKATLAATRPCLDQQPGPNLLLMMIISSTYEPLPSFSLSFHPLGPFTEVVVVQGSSSTPNVLFGLFCSTSAISKGS